MATKKKPEPPPPPKPKCSAIVVDEKRRPCILDHDHDDECDDGVAAHRKHLAAMIEQENARNKRRALDAARRLREVAADIENAANGAVGPSMVPSSLRNVSFPIADAVEALAQLEIRAQTAALFKD